MIDYHVKTCICALDRWIPVRISNKVIRSLRLPKGNSPGKAQLDQDLGRDHFRDQDRWRDGHKAGVGRLTPMLLPQIQLIYHEVFSSFKNVSALLFR